MSPAAKAWSTSTLAATHHVEVQGFAEVYLIQQEQQPAPHLLGFKQQTVDGLSRSTLAQELQHSEESQVLLGHVILHQQTLCTCRSTEQGSVCKILDGFNKHPSVMRVSYLANMERQCCRPSVCGSRWCCCRTPRHQTGPSHS